MRPTPFTHFERPAPRTGKMKRARYMVPLAELPKGAVAVGTVEWRDLPESEAEQQCTAGFLHNEPGPVPPDWSGRTPSRAAMELVF